MDHSSQRTTFFLESLQDAMADLRRTANHYVRRGGAAVPSFLVLSARPFTILEEAGRREFRGAVSLGLHVTGSDRREYELGVDVLWDDEGWTIQTEASVETDDGGQALLRALSEQHAATLEDCVSMMRTAVASLTGFEDLVPG